VEHLAAEGEPQGYCDDQVLGPLRLVLRFGLEVRHMDRPSLKHTPPRDEPEIAGITYPVGPLTGPQ
jgi:hypothetical protein